MDYFDNWQHWKHFQGIQFIQLSWFPTSSNFPWRSLILNNNFKSNLWSAAIHQQRRRWFNLFLVKSTTNYQQLCSGDLDHQHQHLSWSQSDIRAQFRGRALGLELLSYFQNWNCAKQNISCFETINIFVYFCLGCNCYLTSKIKITQSWIYPVLKQPRLKKELYHGRVNVLWRNIFPVFPHRRLLEKLMIVERSRVSLGVKFYVR